MGSFRAVSTGACLPGPRGAQETLLCPTGVQEMFYNGSLTLGTSEFPISYLKTIQIFKKDTILNTQYNNLI